MNQHNYIHRHTGVDLEHATLPACNKEKSDLTILRYMVKRTYTHVLDLSSDVPLPTIERKRLAISQEDVLDLSSNAPLPTVHYVEERRSRTHRVVIYQPRALLQGNDLFFVGFVSRVREQVEPSIIEELHRVDKLLITEVATNPGLFSYSSLEVHNGYWYNLVLLSAHTAKSYFRSLDIHTYAAQHLAIYYYLWIRLHNGLMPGGLLANQMTLHSTKYYTFPEERKEPGYP